MFKTLVQLFVALLVAGAAVATTYPPVPVEVYYEALCPGDFSSSFLFHSF
jgi:hypothetical protein